MTALSADPIAGGTLFFASGANLYGTNNGGNDWYLLGSNNSSANITAITAGSAPHLVYVGRADGTVQSVSPFGVNAARPVWQSIYIEPNKKPVAELAAYGNGLMNRL